MGKKEQNGGLHRDWGKEAVWDCVDLKHQNTWGGVCRWVRCSERGGGEVAAIPVDSEYLHPYTF
jgi:hypothetical protein